jgi:diaminopimelate decarboxylase
MLIMSAPIARDARTEWHSVAREAVTQFGTPCYVTRVRPIVAALAALDDALPGARSWLSFKTHPLIRLVDWWARSGRGVEVVSEYELVAALRAGCSIDQILVNGVAKHAWLPRHPIPRLRVHLDSSRELNELLPLALRYQWRVGIRMHAPDEADARDPRFGGQFGMTGAEAVDALHRLRLAGADVHSLHFHLGQGRLAAGARKRAVMHVARVCAAASFRPRVLDCGGGLSAGPSASMALSELRSAIRLAHRELSPELEEIWLENGRFITERASVLAVRILDIKERPEGRYVICDGGRTNHALAADHGPHPLMLMPDRHGAPRLTTICGPTCMTDDRLGRVDLPEDVSPGDCLLWMGAGAYHLPWETRFSHGLCPVVWADEAEHLTLAREREQPEEWARCGH